MPFEDGRKLVVQVTSGSVQVDLRSVASVSVPVVGGDLRSVYMAHGKGVAVAASHLDLLVEQIQAEVREMGENGTGAHGNGQYNDAILNAQRVMTAVKTVASSLSNAGRTGLDALYGLSEPERRSW